MKDIKKIQEFFSKSIEESYMISKSGSKSNPHYVLEKPDGSKQIDMMFDSPEEAKKYADKKNIKLSSKTGHNMNESISGNTLTKILDSSIVDQLKEKIKQINKIFPKHDIALKSHSFSDDQYLKNRYTISYSGPSDEQFKKTIQTLTQKYSDKSNLNEQEDAVDTITMDIPLFLRMLEYAREDAQEDMDLHDVTEKANLLGKERGILQMEDYNEIVGTSEDTPIQEMIKSALNGKVLKRKK
jgi:hypothetical protein